MAGKRIRKRRGPIRAVLHGLLTLIDRLCEGVAVLGVAFLRGLLAAVRLLLRAIAWLTLGVLRVVTWPLRWLARRIGARNNVASRCLRLTGDEFEAYVAQVLRDNGFRHVEVTQQSGDQGVDILCERNARTYAIQCKNYAGAVGNAAVQEAFAGSEYYGCDIAAVVCPGHFTRSARELAASTGVQLWDGERLSHMMRVSGRRPRHSAARGRRAG